MRPPCELVVQHVLPAFRSLVARELVENYHLSQTAVAERIGTTQATVSLYLDSKRGDKIMKQLVNAPAIRKVAHEVAEGIATRKYSFTDSMTKFCELCVALRNSDVVCKLYHDPHISHTRMRGN
jgi:predicted transcriptional regulator